MFSLAHSFSDGGLEVSLDSTGDLELVAVELDSLEVSSDVLLALLVRALQISKQTRND